MGELARKTAPPPTPEERAKMCGPNAGCTTYQGQPLRANTKIAVTGGGTSFQVGGPGTPTLDGGHSEN